MTFLQSENKWGWGRGAIFYGPVLWCNSRTAAPWKTLPSDKHSNPQVMCQRTRFTSLLLCGNSFLYLSSVRAPTGWQVRKEDCPHICFYGFISLFTEWQK